MTRSTTMSYENAAPPHVMGLAKLMTETYRGADMQPIIQQLINRSTANPKDTAALMDMSILLQFQGQRELALAMQAQALGLERHYRLPSARQPAGFKLLAIMAPGDLMSNTPLEFLVKDSDIRLDMFYVGPSLPAVTNWPAADAAFIAISEADQNQPILRALQRHVEALAMPIINQPSRIARLGRDSACSLLQSIPNLVMPMFARVDRKTLEQLSNQPGDLSELLDEEAQFPLIVRPLDSHAGHGLSKVDDAQGLGDYLQTSEKSQFYIARYIDYRSEDGLFRKYRVILIDGKPYAVHMGVSENWMIHYLNAGMNDSAEKREEEARFMGQFDDVFGAKHEQAFKAIYQRMGLDYLGIDCAETRHGDLLIFEVHSAMVVHDMDSAEQFPYKQPQMRKVFAAFRAMLDRRVKGEGGSVVA